MIKPETISAYDALKPIKHYTEELARSDLSLKAGDTVLVDGVLYDVVPTSKNTHQSPD